MIISLLLGVILVICLVVICMFFCWLFVVMGLLWCSRVLLFNVMMICI